MSLQIRLDLDAPPQFEGLRFDGETFSERLDGPRLNRQCAAVYELMKDAEWRSLWEIEEATGAPTQSVSARLRDMRKARFGGHTVSRRRRTGTGVFEYRLVVNAALEAV